MSRNSALERSRATPPSVVSFEGADLHPAPEGPWARVPPASCQFTVGRRRKGQGHRVYQERTGYELRHWRLKKVREMKQTLEAQSRHAYSGGHPAPSGSRPPDGRAGHHVIAIVIAHLVKIHEEPAFTVPPTAEARPPAAREEKLLFVDHHLPVGAELHITAMLLSDRVRPGRMDAHTDLYRPFSVENGETRVHWLKAGIRSSQRPSRVLGQPPRETTLRGSPFAGRPSCRRSPPAWARRLP